MPTAYTTMKCTECGQPIHKGEEYARSFRPRHMGRCPDPVEEKQGRVESAPQGRAWKSRRMVSYRAAKAAGMNHGKPFRANEDHPATHGISPDMVGELVCYVYER